jgi:hypothetical protein
MSKGLLIKVYPELAAASLRERRDQGLFLWSLARGIDPDGKGFVLKEIFIKELVQRGLFNIKTLQHLMKNEGRDIFWAEVIWKDPEGKEHRALRYNGLLQVADELACRALSAPVCVPEQDIGTTLFQRRAKLSAVASAAPRGRWMNPRSRRFLEKYLGREQTTQRRYEAAAGVRVVSNYYRDYTDPLRPSTGQLPNCRYHQFKKLKMGQAHKYRPSEAPDRVAGATLRSRLYFVTNYEAREYLAARKSALGCAYVLQKSQRNAPARYDRLFWETRSHGDSPRHALLPQNRRA